MKLQFKATGTAPDSYDISGETINGIDLSPLDQGGKFVGNEETREAGIRDAYRDEDGELHVTLEQAVIASQYPGEKAHWREGEEIDAEEYDPDTCLVIPTGVEHLTEGEDYRTVWADGRAAGEEGWTIQPLTEEDDD